MRITQDIVTEIEGRFGFVPPFFTSALETPEVLENLWRQTLAAYLGSPLPPLFLEQLFAMAARYCAIPYCLACHTSALRPLGMTGPAVLALLEEPTPGAAEIDAALAALDTLDAVPLATWPPHGSPAERALLGCAIVIFLYTADAARCRAALRSTLSTRDYDALASFLGYVKTCLQWGETHPELDYARDERYALHFGPLVAQEPRLAGLLEHFGVRADEQPTREEPLLAEIAERRRAEDALRAREREYRMLMEQAFDGILVCDADARCLEVNRACCDMLGYASEEIRGQKYADLLLPEDLTLQPLRFEALRLHGHVATERRFRRKDGTVLAAEVGATLLEDGRILTMLRDITDRQRAESALRESEARFRNAVDHSGIGMALVAPDGKWLMVNGALCETVGYSQEELLALTFQDITHPDDLASDLGLVGRVLSGELQTYQLEKRYLHKQGHAVWIMLTVSLVRDAAGVPLHFIAQVQDITHRKEAEAAQARLTAILEAMPDIVAICTPDGQLPYLNRAGRRLLGLGDEQVLHGVTALDVQPQFAKGGALEDATRTALRVGVWRGETTLRKRDGRELPVDQVVLAHQGADGSVEHFSTVIRDISERKQAEATMRALSLIEELTGLYNRRGFLTLAEKEWQRAAHEGRPVLLFYMDLDEFKSINDVYGHAEGDAALAAVARVLKVTFREADVLGRIGGDEFTALAVHGGRDTEDVVLARLRRELASHNASAGRPYDLGLSVGVARAAPGDSGAPATLASLIDEADAELYRQKRARKKARARG